MQCKSCFFIGHREAGPEILPALEDAIEKHISENGVTEFIVGHYGGFDRLAAKALVSAKKMSSRNQVAHADSLSSGRAPCRNASRL